MATPAERVEAAGRWLVSVGGLSTPGDLGAALGLNHARQADVVRALRDGGLVDGPQKELRLTPAGWAMFSTPDAEGGEVLARVLNACLPQWAYGHAAYARLLVSATVAKGHLFATRPDDHLSLIALGPQGTGKTFLARLVCEVLGLDWRRHLVQLDDETRGSLRGRRGQVGDEGWRLESAAWAGLPLVVFDEIDKAPPAARTAVWRYLRGQGVVYVEGEPHEVRPVAMVAGNPPEGAAGDPARALLPEGTRRRSVILSTGYVGGRTGELAERIDAGMRSLTPADRLALARLRPPLVELPVEVRAVLREAGRMVTPAHGPTPFLGLEAAALGRLALAGGDPMAATVGTLVDYLAVTGTTPGMVDPGWLARAAGLRAWVADGGHGDVAGVLESIERGQDAARSASRELRVSRAAAGDELVRDRAVMVAHLDRAAAALDGKVTRSWPAPVKIDAASIRAVLVRLREDAAASRSREALEDVRARSLPYGAQVDELTRGAQAAREMAELQAAQERKQIEWDRNAQREGEEYRRRQEAAQRTAAVVELETLMPVVKELERMYRRTGRAGARPTVALRGCRVDGRPLLEFRPDQVQPIGGGFAGRVLSAMFDGGGRMGEWFDVSGRFLGRGLLTEGPPVLREWGAGTREVIAPVLRDLRAREDRLREAAGRRRRSSRVA